MTHKLNFYLRPVLEPPELFDDPDELELPELLPDELLFENPEPLELLFIEPPELKFLDGSEKDLEGDDSLAGEGL
jgi:hypothetical protein